MKILFGRIVLAVVALALLGLGAIGLVASRSIDRLTSESDRVKHAQKVLTRLAALLSTMTDAEAGQRGFVVTGDDRFLEPYRGALANSATVLGELRRLTADNPAQQRHLDALAALVEARFALVASMIELRRTQGFEVARHEIATGKGKEIQDEIRHRIAEMSALEERLLREREVLTAAAARASQDVINLGTGLAIAVVTLALFLLERHLTARRRAEAELWKLNAELSAAKQRAESGDRLKSAFLATMSHELRTPLNSIIGFTGIILQELAGPLNEEQRKQLEMVRGSGRHLLALINDVLDISKIEAGQLQVGCAAFDARAAIERSVISVRPLAEKKGLALRVDVAPTLGEMVGDVRRVEQILLNLLSNAIKFTECGEVALSANTDGVNFVARVADTGMGIKPEDMTTLFKPFQQIDTGLSRQSEGTGLGLAICRRLAELLGGDIRAESEWGNGSTFTVTLPLKRAAQA